MAIRVEELDQQPLPFGGAQVYAFPTHAVRARASRRAAVARRRMALGATVVIIAGMMLFAGGSGAVSSAGSAGAPRAITVHPGQTLWGIADRYAPDGVDPRAYVDAVLTLNHLSAPPVAGERIRLPR